MNPLNLKPLAGRSPLLPERVTVPGVEEAEVEALQEGFDRFARTRLGYLRAMMHKGVMPYAGTVSGAEKARRRARGKRAKAARRIARAS